MMLVLLSIVPTLLWDEGPATAPQLKQAGIHQIAVTRDPGAWSATGITVERIDGAKLTRLDTIGVDYQIGRAGASAAPWVESNLWRMIRHPDALFLYEVPAGSLPLAVAEAYAGGARTFFRVKPADLGRFAAPYRFISGLHGPPLQPRVNFTLADDRSPEIDEVMNLLVRRNLLFDVAGDRAPPAAGMQVRIGAPGYPKDTANDPNLFAAVVRSHLADDNRLVRVFGADTVLFRMYGQGTHARVHLLRYGRRSPQGMRVRVLGRYPRVHLAGYGRDCDRVTEVSIDDTATEFTIPELGPFAIVDLESAAPGLLHSARASGDVALSADPESAFWKTAPRTSGGADTFGQAVALPPMEVRSRWTADSLYLLYICPFEQLHLKPNPATDRDTPSLWDWDVAEAFIGAEASSQYREFELSPQGEWVDLDIGCDGAGRQHRIDWNSGFKTLARIDRDRKIWYGEMRIPMSALPGGAPKPGRRLALGLYRSSGPPPGTKYISWQPTHRRTFHVPESFGALILD